MTKRGIAKVVGTILCVGGAILLSFYHGKIIGIPDSSIHWSYAQKVQGGSGAADSSSHSLIGPIALILSALICVSSWSLLDSMRLTSSLYSGVICTGLTYCIFSWTIEKKGPLYVSVFTPMQLILTAIISWAFIREKLFLGTAIGSVLIVGGLYAVLWGKSKEVGVDSNRVDDADDDDDDEDCAQGGIKKNDMEMQSYTPSNGNGHI
ncbi:hypothetical protein TSUD_344140 [Trifolium subterraneum]|nr:hypothetical protein TSUD_344140 [Trifolium subterraneum]